MKLEALKSRIDELIAFSSIVLKTKTSGTFGDVDYEPFNEFRSASLSFFKSTFSENHPFYQEFDKKVSSARAGDTLKGLGILKAAKQEIDGGWMFSVRELVSSEIFSDFLEMAEYFLKEGYKDSAAVMIGSVLEERLRQLSIKNYISITNNKDGKTNHKKADALNNELYTANVYNKLVQKSIVAWLDLRNEAAHGQYNEYTKEQVNIMYQGVTNFIACNF